MAGRIGLNGENISIQLYLFTLRLYRQPKDKGIKYRSQLVERNDETMFVKDAAKPLVSVVAGVQRKTLAVGEHTLMSKFVLEAGSELPLHKHPHEQIGFLVSGKLILTIGDEACSLEPGDSWAVPGGVEHKAEVLERAEAIEVFYPVRQDYL